MRGINSPDSRPHPLCGRRARAGGESCASERDHILCTGGTDARSIRPPEVMPV